MEDSTRILKLREYLMGIIATLNADYQQVNVNFLSNEIDNYSLDKIPEASTVEKWIAGVELHRDVYSFRSRMNYSADVIDNIKNIGFFEKFEEKIRKKNKKKELPSITGIESIICLNCGSMTNAETSTAEFDIQIQIEYRIGGQDETDSEVSM